MFIIVFYTSFKEFREGLPMQLLYMQTILFLAAESENSLLD